MLFQYLKNQIIANTQQPEEENDDPKVVTATEFHELIENACKTDQPVRHSYHVKGNVTITDDTLAQFKAYNPLGDFMAAMAYNRILTIDGNLHSSAGMVTEMSRLEQVNGNIKLTNPAFSDLSSLQTAKDMDVKATAIIALPALIGAREVKTGQAFLALLSSDKLNRPAPFSAPRRNLPSAIRNHRLPAGKPVDDIGSFLTRSVANIIYSVQDIFDPSLKPDAKTGLVKLNAQEFDALVLKNCRRGRKSEKRYHIADHDSYSVYSDKASLRVEGNTIEKLRAISPDDGVVESYYDSIVKVDGFVRVMNQTEKVDVPFGKPYEQVTKPADISGFAMLEMAYSIDDDGGALKNLDALKVCERLILNNNQRITSLPSLESVGNLQGEDSTIASIPNLRQVTAGVNITGSPLAGKRSGDIIYAKDASMTHNGYQANAICLLSDNREGNGISAKDVVQIGADTEPLTDFMRFADYRAQKASFEFKRTIQKELGLEITEPHKRKGKALRAIVRAYEFTQIFK